LGDLLLRSARKEDFPAIRALIRETGINPTGLDWHHFLVAELPDGRFVGCGQLKPHFDGTLELASIAVKADWRGNGVARQIIQALMEKAPRPLYLTCRGSLGVFYEKFGFRVLQRDEMPPYFRRISRVAEFMGKLINDKLLVMKAD
jgi:N-acetylglutamate synthase-like GNAT family acetyltransferase